MKFSVYLKMKFWFLFSSILVSLITVTAKHFSFGQDRNSLRECLRDHLIKDSNLKISKAAKHVAEFVLNRFHNKSYDKRQFDHASNYMFYSLRDKKSYLFSDNNVPSELRISIKEALKNCVEKRNLPQFDHEPRELAEFLDFVLVDWPKPPKEMIRTQSGRSTLRLYAYSTGVRLVSALTYYMMDFKVFRQELKRTWMLRAQRCFDDDDNKFSYIRHFFTTNEDRVYSSTPLEDVHTIDDPNSFISSERKNNTITKHFAKRAENYLEAHIQRCYRIIFFVLELQLRGINTDEDDIYDGPIPSDIVSLITQEIVSSGAAYHYYLINLRSYLEQYPSEEYADCFSGKSEEDLIMLLTMLIIRKSTTTTSTTTGTTVKSLDYGEGPKKGGVRAGNCGKYFSPSKKNFHKQYTINQSYGFILDDGQFSQLISFPENRESGIVHEGL